MQVLNTPLSDVKLIQPKRFGDSRGWFAEVFNQSTFSHAGLPTRFVQDNQSFSVKGVLRGLHYQLGQPQGKLVRVLSGHIWDVAVDLRPNSPDFGKWAGFHLKTQSTDDELQLLERRAHHLAGRRPANPAVRNQVRFLEHSGIEEFTNLRIYELTN